MKNLSIADTYYKCGFFKDSDGGEYPRDEKINEYASFTFKRTFSIPNNGFTY